MHENLKCLILDFDGVIVESNHIKDDAFRLIFSEYPEHFDRLWNYHIQNNATDRIAKFHYLVNEVLGQSNLELEKQLALKFNDLTLEAIFDCPFVPGALEFLQFFQNKVPLYLASATPLKQLKMILQKRDLLKYFKEIYGSEIPKINAISQVLESNKLKGNQALFIGDSPEDFTASIKTGISFLARRSDRFDASRMPEPYDDLNELLKIVRGKICLS